MHRILGFAFLVAITGNVVLMDRAHAQLAGGEVAAGLRLGGSTGASVKFFSNTNRSAVELLGLWNFNKNSDGFAITGLWERLAAFNDNKRLCALIGGGPSVLFGDEFRVGVSGIIGFDWRLKVPLNLQLDWAPTWYFVNGSTFNGSNLALSVRYVLNRKRK
jgi:hypothetical protein